MLTFVKHKDLDQSKWSQLEKSSKNSSTYNSWDYLKVWCKWSAVILGDYEGAIALPYRVRFGLKFLYQPNFIQLCNWFGEELQQNQVTQLFEILSTQFHHINFNSNLNITRTAQSRTNQILHLTSYEYIKGQYSKTLRKNIVNHTNQVTISEDINPDHTIGLYKNAYGKLNPQLEDLHYELLKNLVLEQPKQFLNIHIFTKSELIGSVLLLKSNSRLHYILGAPNKLGRKLNAISIGIDHVLQKYSNQDITFDFEGSSIPSVKNYYASFGAKQETFYTVKYSRLWLKPLNYLYSKLFRS